MSLTPTGDVLLHWNSCKFESDSRRESFLDKNTISWQGHLELMWVVLNVYWSVVEADFFLFWHGSGSENFRYVITFVLQYPSAWSKTTSKIFQIYRGSQFMYFNKKTVHTSTNSLGRGSNKYVGCHWDGFHCKGNHCHCHLVGCHCHCHCHSVSCHNKGKHCHQVCCHHSKFSWGSSLSRGGVIVPVGSLMCSTCLVFSHITMFKAHWKFEVPFKVLGPVTKFKYHGFYRTL